MWEVKETNEPVTYKEIMAQAHPTLDPAFLDGKWEGTGSVFVQSTGLTVEYKEVTEFKLLRQEPVWLYNYQQYTRHAESGSPMHAENGFWKILPPDSEGIRKVEASFSHPFSINEFEIGRVGKNDDGHTFVTMRAPATTDGIQRGPTCATGGEDRPGHKRATGMRREFWIDDADGSLNYKMHLGVNGKELYHHLTCKLQKTTS